MSPCAQSGAGSERRRAEEGSSNRRTDLQVRHPPSWAEMARAMGERGRRKAETALTWDAVAARYREGYVSALSDPSFRS